MDAACGNDGIESPFQTMAHELTPKPGRPPLPMEEILQRLQSSFAHVEVDVERASRSLEEQIRHMRRVGGPHFTAQDIEDAKRLIGHAVLVVLADDPSTAAAYLDFILEPDHECIFLGYESEDHEDASGALRERLAQVLDYDIELV